MVWIVLGFFSYELCLTLASFKEVLVFLKVGDKPLAAVNQLIDLSCKLMVAFKRLIYILHDL